MYPILFFLGLVGLSFILVLFIRRWLLKRAILDIPSERSSHTIPTPRGGGIAIVILVLLTVLVYSLITREWKTSLVFIAGGSILAYLGWRDDIKSLPARVRILAQCLVAIGTIAGLGYFEALPFPFTNGIHLGVFGILLTIIWIVGLANAFNFMDGVDGIAGSVAFVGGMGWMYLIVAGAGSTSGLAFWLALAVAASSQGFLGHNWSPAKIFMGDVGSVFLGYCFAVLPLISENRTVQPLMIGIVIMWAFIIDPGVTFIRRAFKGEKLFTAHRSHLFQRLVQNGMKHASVSFIYELLTALGVIVALGWFYSQKWAHWSILVGIPVFWAIFLFLGTRKNLWQRLSGYASLYKSMGLGWILYRIWYSVQKKVGLLARSSPAYSWTDTPLSSLVKEGIPNKPEEYASWRNEHAPKWFYDHIPDIPKDASWDDHQVLKDAERIISGEWEYFSSEWIKTGFPPDWHTDPKSGIQVDSQNHWSRIPEYGDYDIKYIWEASRFSMVYTLIRAYASKPDEKFAESFWKLVEDWMVKNSPGCGANWMDGQECALRLMAICFGYFAFRDSTCSSAERISRLTIMAAALGKRIDQNAGFAIHTRSNHAVSVGAGLWLCGLIFPELERSDHYLQRGKIIFETEMLRQIFPDGGYSMYSINYHRFVMHLGCLVLRLAELNGYPFSKEVYNKMERSIYHFSQLINKQTGEIPVYGSDDGALILPLDDCDYQDYRPILQLASYIIHRKRLFGSGPWDETLFWLCGPDSIISELETGLIQRDASFPNAGVYILRGEYSKAVIRCTDFKERPSHADQLHLDLWWKEVNIACDSGTYMYHGEGIWQNGLAHTSVHNTVCVDEVDQMTHLSRFTWGNWSKGKVLFKDTADGNKIWQGRQDGYLRLSDPVKHCRGVVCLDGDRWLVFDKMTAAQVHKYDLQWLLAYFPYQSLENGQGVELDIRGEKMLVFTGLVEGSGEFTVVRGDENSTRGWRSRYYGQKETATSIILSAKAAKVTFYTLFAPAAGGSVSHKEILEMANRFLFLTR